MAYTNSPLVNYTKISQNRTKNRNHTIDTITIHCVVGQTSVQTLGDVFYPSSRQASSNYGVGYDGKIGMYVEEKDRSWCSSSASNDHRAVTIEVASDTTHPYAVNAKAYAALLDLVTDICKRNGIKKLVWSTDKNNRINHLNGCNMTVHRDYANKSCPGDYLYNRLGEIAAEVNKRLGTAASSPNTNSGTSTTGSFLVKVIDNDLNIRKGAGTSYAVVGQIKDHGTYTIVETKGTIGQAGSWGKLKSGKGWISLNSCYVQRITSQATSSVIKGDLNGDGKVTAADARIALQIAAGLQKPTAEQLKAGDIDGDGKIGANDARAILRMAAGLKK